MEDNLFYSKSIDLTVNPIKENAFTATSRLAFDQKLANMAYPS